jgi:hypothetical protein
MKRDEIKKKRRKGARIDEKLSAINRYERNKKEKSLQN